MLTARAENPHARRGAHVAVVLGICVCCSEGLALIVGRDAEADVARLEKQGRFKEAAVWRLVAARGFQELIIPFERESVRAYKQFGKEKLARICAERAEALYPRKVAQNLLLYEQDLQKAGGAGGAC